MSIITIARQNVQQLKPYQSARRLGGKGDIWLNANEYPCSPELKLSSSVFNRYPEPQPLNLLKSYANYVGLQPENILVSRGGDEGIELVIRAFCEPNQDKILYCPPTYGIYAVSAESIGVEQIVVPQTSDFQLDLASIRQQLEQDAKIKVIFVCNPNNPTGTILRRADLIELLEFSKNRAIVVLDEAYIEFSPTNSLVSELAKYPQLAIIRTLSKAFALAGLRCGFVLANPELIQILNKVIAPYPIPVPVADLASQALSSAGLEAMFARVQDSLKLRAELEKELKKIAHIEQVLPSHGNYLLVKCKDGNRVFNALWQQGIILRNQDQAFALTNCIRISLGTQAENQALIQALQQLA